MKVRWTGDSLRLRITPGELDALERGEEVCEALAFPGGGAWSVRLDPAAPAAALAWDGGTAQVGLAPSDVRRLAAPEAETARFAPTPAFLARKAGG
jgi:hypothetical protein